MRFLVPQFIDRETRIVGPLTLKQFGFIGGAAIVCFFLWVFLKGYFFIWLLSSILVVFMGFSLAFVQVHGVSLPSMIQNLFSFLIKPKLFLWKKNEQKTDVLGSQFEIIEMKKDEIKKLPMRKGGNLKNLERDLYTKK